MRRDIENNEKRREEIERIMGKDDIEREDNGKRREEIERIAKREERR